MIVFSSSSSSPSWFISGDNIGCSNGDSGLVIL